MKVLTILYLCGCKAYYDRACRHDPTHPDLPFVLRKRAEYSDKLRQAWA